MSTWLPYAVLAIALWGVVGLLQKLGTNRISARSLLVWLTVGFLLLFPWFLRHSSLLGLKLQDTVIGILAGIINGLGSWFLFKALEQGAKASVAIPMTALYPLVTVLLATAFLGESLTASQWTGVCLALVSGVMLSCES